MVGMRGARVLHFGVAMASRPFIFSVLVLSLLCTTTCLAAWPRFISVSLDDLNTDAEVDCPPLSPADGNKLPIVRPGQCWAADDDASGLTHGGIHDRDNSRLTSLLLRSSSVPAVSLPQSTAPAPTSPLAPAPSVSIPDHSGESLGVLDFVVVVGYGTPAKPFTVIFDTGSDLSWIQCLPCECYAQHDPLFNPSQSSSFSPVPCGSPLCSAVGGRCNETSCLYSAHYGDGSFSFGVFAKETLSLTSSRALANFHFGCGQRNNGKFGGVAGLLGLGRGQVSLPSQASSVFGTTFSYCLPSFENQVGFLAIGSLPVSRKTQLTKMVQNSRLPTFYFVELVSINIGGFVLPVPPTVFTSGGTIIDSGTTLTYLPQPAYAALRDRFKFTMQQYMPAPPFEGLDTCYNFTGQSAIVIPAVTLGFADGAEFDLDFFGILYFPVPQVIGCLAFAARPSGFPFSIIGNIQQRSTEVVYDIAAEKIGFTPGSC